MDTPLDQRHQFEAEATCAPRCILIVGMHRSGTSSLAGSLQERGLCLGQVFTENPHNAKGNRENAQVMDLNERVLAASGGAWDAPPKNLTWSEELSQHRDQLIASYEQASQGPWGFKDPRTLVTLPFWEAGLRHINVVGTFRHPLSVAQSLRQRSGMRVEQGLELWRIYNRKLLKVWQRQPFPLISFDVPPDEYSEAICRASAQLRIQQPLGDSSFFDRNLRHHTQLQDRTALSEDDLLTYESLKNIYSMWLSA